MMTLKKDKKNISTVRQIKKILKSVPDLRNQLNKFTKV